MDQAVWNGAMALIAGLGGWVVKVIWEAVKDLRKDVRQIERDMSEVYVRKDDFREAVREIKETMRDGFNKMDASMHVLFKRTEKHPEK